MSTTDLLRTNCERLLSQFTSNIQTIVTLQTTLIRDILPSIDDELGLDPEATDWAREWLEDSYTLFRICRRNKFINSFAMESIRKNLVWRLNNLWPLVHSKPVRQSTIFCLPQPAQDMFGRPIILIKATPLTVSVEEVKISTIQIFEQLRQHLKKMNGPSEGSPILQYTVLLDLRESSIKNFDIHTLTWTLREIIPRFPGMLAGVFVLNYSWLHAGMWAAIKRVLPESALSRVFFLSCADLPQFISPSSLPEEYGGTLSAQDLLNDPLLHMQENSSPHQVSQGEILEASPSPNLPNQPTSISPMSLLNPFFGYPASLAYGSLSLEHGRRRKRDLVRTLLLLFWIRWRKVLIAGFFVAFSAILLRLATRGSYARFLKPFLSKLSFLRVVVPTESGACP